MFLSVMWNYDPYFSLYMNMVGSTKDSQMEDFVTCTEVI